MFGIITFGNSITWGRGEMPNVSWAGRLKQYFESQDLYNALFNLGIPGNTSRDLLKRFPTELSSRINYDREGDKFLILIAIGINDCKGVGSPDNTKVKIDEFKDNFEKLIQIAKKHTKHVVAIGLTPVDEKRTNPFENTYFTNKTVKKYDDVIKETSKNNKIRFIDILTKMSQEDYPKLLVDGLHPNSKGYDFMYGIIKDFLVKEKLIN